MREQCECVASTARLEEAIPSPSTANDYDVFLGGSCGTTVWRRQMVIPFLKKRAITYYDPQRSQWNENMIYEESIAKENSSLFLFVIDPATVNATSFLEIAYFAARKSPKLVVVFLGRTEWAERAHPQDLPDRNRTCNMLDRILEAHNVPVLHSIQEALVYIEEEIIGSKHWNDVISIPAQRLVYLSLRTRRAAREAKDKAHAAWTRVRSVATKAGIAGLIDSVILLALQLLGPTIPLFLVILPLIFLNIIVIIAVNKVQTYRASRPRFVVDSSFVPIKPSAAIPSPRVPTVTTPLNAKQPKQNVHRSRKFCEELAVDDGSSSFFVPENFKRKPQNGKIKLPEVSSCLEIVGSASDDTTWLNERVVPLLDGHSIHYSCGLTSKDVLPEMRMSCFKMWSLQYKQFLYYIPSTTTFLSGMVEIAYMLGHSSWQVTVCVAKEAETLEGLAPEEEQERAARRRRNDCYQIAFCYLKDMAKRRQCRIFSDIGEAVSHVSNECQKGLL